MAKKAQTNLSISRTLELALRWAFATDKPQTVVATDRGYQVLRPGESAAKTQSHYVVYPDGVYKLCQWERDTSKMECDQKKIPDDVFHREKEKMGKKWAKAGLKLPGGSKEKQMTLFGFNCSKRRRYRWI